MSTKENFEGYRTSLACLLGLLMDGLRWITPYLVIDGRVVFMFLPV